MMKIMANRMDRGFFRYQKEFEDKALEVLRSGWYVLGNEVKSFEEEFAAYTGGNYCVGLASGLDTEAMIEGLVQGYQQKISKLQQENTTLQWQQEAYQSISDKLVEFARKYTSYTSPSTNLFSNSFFNNAVLTSTGGTYADLVSASGKSTSDVVINAVAQLATAARITSSGVGIDHSISSDGGKITVTGGDVDLTGDMNVSTMSGTLTLSYGNNQEVTIRFDELELYNKDDGTLDTDALWAEERLCLPVFLYDPPQGQAVQLPWQTPAADPGSAWYLYQYELAGRVRPIDQVTGELHDPGRVLADLAVGNGTAARYFFPDLPAAQPGQFDEARELVQQRLLEFLRGDSELLLGIPLYEASNGMTAWMEARSWMTEILFPDASVAEQLQQISDALWIDLQTIQLDNELLVVVGERGSGGMVCLYYDVRLRCVTGLVMEY